MELEKKSHNREKVHNRLEKPHSREKFHNLIIKHETCA
jgi:hypothetical protein